MKVGSTAEVAEDTEASLTRRLFSASSATSAVQFAGIISIPSNRPPFHLRLTPPHFRPNFLFCWRSEMASRSRRSRVSCCLACRIHPT